MTMYPSQVVEKYIGLKQDPVYGRRDPIREISGARSNTCRMARLKGGYTDQVVPG